MPLVRVFSKYSAHNRKRLLFETVVCDAVVEGRVS